MLLGELNPCGGGDAISLTEQKLLIGRRSHCDICLRFKSVSSHHCELELKNGYWHVRDLGSKNGIKVNGMRVDAKVLMPGDELMIAKLAYNIDYSVDMNAPPPEEESPFAMSLMEKAGLSVASSRHSERAKSRSTSERRRPSRRSSTRSSEDAFLMEWFSEE
ncbi:MAG: hypothetical protein Fues2KO_18540 [Fuerstiella sp.]